MIRLCLVPPLSWSNSGGAKGQGRCSWAKHLWTDQGSRETENGLVVELELVSFGEILDLFQKLARLLCRQGGGHAFQGLLSSKPSGACGLSDCPRRYPVSRLSRSITLRR